MSGKMDEFKGRAKQAVSEFTDDEELEREGKADEIAGKAKQAAEKAKDTFDDMVDKVRGDD